MSCPYTEPYYDDDDDEPRERLCLGCGFAESHCECGDEPEDCYNCGVCEYCIERSRETAREMQDE